MPKAPALFHLFLILSLNPLMAHRQLQAEDGFRELAVLKSDASELEEAIQEIHRTTVELEELEAASRSQQNVSYWGESWASCEDLLEDFSRRSHALRELAEQVDEEGDDVKAKTVSRTVHKSARVAQTLKWAVKRGCEWTKNTLDIPEQTTADLKKAMTTFEKSNKCFIKGQEIIANITDKAEVERQAQHAFLLMMADESTDCAVPQVESEHLSHESLDELERETDMDEEGNMKGDTMKQMDEALGSLDSEGALLEVGQVGHSRQQSFRASIQRADSQFRTAIERRFQGLMDAVGKKSASSIIIGVLTAIGAVVGLIVAVILLAILCSILFSLFLLIFGFCLCLLKFMALWIANVFILLYKLVSGSDREIWRPDLFKCSGWWLDELLETSQNTFHLALCVASLMNKN